MWKPYTQYAHNYHKYTKNGKINETTERYYFIDNQKNKNDFNHVNKLLKTLKLRFIIMRSRVQISLSLLKNQRGMTIPVIPLFSLFSQRRRTSGKPFFSSAWGTYTFRCLPYRPLGELFHHLHTQNRSDRIRLSARRFRRRPQSQYRMPFRCLTVPTLAAKALNSYFLSDFSRSACFSTFKSRILSMPRLKTLLTNVPTRPRRPTTP